MHSTKMISIITPVFNGAQYISETIDSVLKCAEKYDYEYIVVNDGSTDESLSIVNGYADRITILNQTNQGESSAINLALKQARGKYCLVVSADDPLLTEDLFEFSLQVLEENEDIVVTYPDWIMINSTNEPIQKVVTQEYSEETLIGKFKCIPGPGAIFRTSLAQQSGGRNPGYRFVSDYDLWLKLSRFGTFYRIPYFLAQWRNHQDSTSIKMRGFEMAHERILVIRNFLSDNRLDVKISREAEANSYYHAAMLSFFTSDVPGRKWMIHALRVYGGWIPGTKMKVVLFTLLLPVSFQAVELLRRVKRINQLLPKTQL